jgi:hypothetical protein
MYLVATVYILTFLFNMRQEFWGPANIGWVPQATFFRVASVRPGSPMETAGVQAGDFLETADGYPLNGAANWFLARAHFEQDRPISFLVRRGEQHLALKLVIAAPVWRSWNGSHYFPAIALQVARLVLLLLAILVAFSRPQQLSARLAALMFAIGAVAEGYPSSGWAAGLRHLPALLALPIGVATASCLLAPVVWLVFFASFPQPQLSQRLRWALVVVPVLLFGIPIVASVSAMIYAPSVLARPWPLVLSAAPVRWLQDTAGVAPLLFLNKLPLYQPTAHARFLEAWLAITIVYFVSGFLMLVASYRRLDDPQLRRRMSALLLALAAFATVVVHNLLVRNWTSWFGSTPPAMFSWAGFVGEAFMFLFVPLTLAYCVLADSPHMEGTTNQTGGDSGVSLTVKEGSGGAHDELTGM